MSFSAVFKENGKLKQIVKAFVNFMLCFIETLESREFFKRFLCVAQFIVKVFLRKFCEIIQGSIGIY